jgi:trehalose-6-phosphate hydrolase
MSFNFHHLKVDYKNGDKWQIQPFDKVKLIDLLHQWNTQMSNGGGWNAWFVNNHDQPRFLNRLNADLNKYHYQLATAIASLIHFNYGTPFIYMGEEIGMLNPDFLAIDEYVDIESLNYYQILLDKGLDKKAALQIIKERSRDNSRIPFAWNDTVFGGFSQVKPWLGCGDYYKINATNQGEIKNFYQKLIALRKKYAVIAFGDYKPLIFSHSLVYAFERAFEGSKLKVLINLSGDNIDCTQAIDFNGWQILSDNYANAGGFNGILKPYQALAVYTI